MQFQPDAFKVQANKDNRLNRKMKLPELLGNNRARDIYLVTALGVFNAGLMFATAFATRAMFTAIAAGAEMPVNAWAILALVPILLAASQAVTRIRAEAIGQSYAIDLRETLFRTISSLPPDVRARRSLGGLSLRFVGDLSSARDWVGTGLTQAMSGIIVFPSAAVVLWLLNPALALAGGLPIAMSLIAFYLVGRHLRTRHTNLRKRRSRAAIAAIERVAHARELALAGRLQKELNTIKGKGREAAKHAIAHTRTTELLRMVPNASLGVGGACILATALHLGLPTGEAAASLSVLAILIIPLREAVGIWDRYAAWSVARDKCQQLFDAADKVPKIRRAGAPVGLSVDHPDLEKPLEIKAGEVLSLSDVDRETAVQIEASIKGETEAAEVDFDTKRRPLVANISKSPLILKGSLRRVAAIAARRRPDDDVITEVLRAVGLRHLVENGGLDQRIAEGGATLLPEDRLRLSVAQAMLSNPDVIVIDGLHWTRLEDGGELFAILEEYSDATIIHDLPEHVVAEAQETDASDTVEGLKP